MRGAFPPSSIPFHHLSLGSPLIDHDACLQQHPITRDPSTLCSRPRSNCLLTLLPPSRNAGTPAHLSSTAQIRWCPCARTCQPPMSSKARYPPSLWSPPHYHLFPHRSRHSTVVARPPSLFNCPSPSGDTWFVCVWGLYILRMNLKQRSAVSLSFSSWPRILYCLPVQHPASSANSTTAGICLGVRDVFFPRWLYDHFVPSSIDSGCQSFLQDRYQDGITIDILRGILRN